jgi:hypothetical protein
VLGPSLKVDKSQKQFSFSSHIFMKPTKKIHQWLPSRGWKLSKRTGDKPGAYVGSLEEHNLPLLIGIHMFNLSTKTCSGGIPACSGRPAFYLMVLKTSF